MGLKRLIVNNWGGKGRIERLYSSLTKTVTFQTATVFQADSFAIWVRVGKIASDDLSQINFF